jgi:predicted nucleic acid-binding protein
VAQHRPRPATQRPSLLALPAAPRFLLLDTNIYINRAAGRLASAVCAAIDQALLFHCSVAIAELTAGIAHADPARPGWSAMRDHYAELCAAIPASRLLTPDAQIWADAGVIAGTLARTQHFQPAQRKECLNDALIFLTAAKAGIPVITADQADFDLIQQIAPEGQSLFC